MRHLNKKLINYFINNSFNNNIYIYKVGNAIYFIKENKRWREIVLERRKSNGNYLFMAKIEINSDKKEGYNFIRQRSIEKNIKYVFSLFLLNRIYKNG